MQATILSFRRGRHTYKPRQYIISIEGIDSKEKASGFIGKKLVWKSPAGKKIEGVISALHGNKGCLRCRFEKGLPGQAVTTKVEVEE